MVEITIARVEPESQTGQSNIRVVKRRCKTKQCITPIQISAFIVVSICVVGH